MSPEERHFRARVPALPKDRVEAVRREQHYPVDIVITSHFGAKSARPLTDAGRAFLRERVLHPRTYADEPVEIQPGRYWEMFKAP